MRGAARSLLVTPWFAAGAGFVIAAGLWIYSPHTVLRFPPNAQNITHCQPGTCVPSSPGNSAGSLTVTTPGVSIKPDQAEHHKHARPDVRNRSAIAGLKFEFKVIWQRGNVFNAVLTVRGKNAPGFWRLYFEIPGAQINDVTGANWQPNASASGGTASAPTGAPGGPDGGGYGGGPYKGDEIRFMINGTGTASMPTSCVFNGDACTFH
jgi:hypothetical protein